MSDEYSDLQSWIEPEIEARVVAWVLREASEFEAAELARIIAERPELEVFKRRIEAVHGLVAVASRMELDPMRLSEPRRQKLIETLGQKAVQRAVGPVAMPSERADRKPSKAWKVGMGIAACLLVAALLASISLPAYTSVRSKSAQTRALNDAKQADYARQPREMDALQAPISQSSTAIMPPIPAAAPRLAALDALKATAVDREKVDGTVAPVTSVSMAPPVGGALSIPELANEAAAGPIPKAEPVQGPTQADLARFGQTRPAERPEPEQEPVTATAAVGGVAMSQPVFASREFQKHMETDANQTEDRIVPQSLPGEMTFSAGETKISGFVQYGSRISQTDRAKTGLGDSGAAGQKQAIAARSSGFGFGAGGGSISMNGANTYSGATTVTSGGTRITAAGATGLATDTDQIASLAAPADAAVNPTFAKKREVISGQQYAFEQAQSDLRPKEDKVSSPPAHEYGDKSAVTSAANIEIPGPSNQPSVNTEEILTKEYTVPRYFGEESGTGSGLRIRQASPDIFAQHGIPFPEGSSAQYSPESHRLIVHNTAANLAAIDRMVAAASATSTSTPTPAPSPQDEQNAKDQPYSTFSLHVSDVSFLLAKAALARGQMPDPESIRPEEFYNAFDYGDPAPGPNEKIACRIEQAAHPLLQQRNLVRIAMKVAAAGRSQPLRLTVLLDTSGSMKRADRAASVQKAMEVLGSLLGRGDSVTVIGFARQPRLLAEEVPGDQGGKLAEIVKHTPPEGGTNMEEALKTASELALRHFSPGAQNRVVMLTDGAANLGDADPARLAEIVAKLRQQGVSFDACGVGGDGLNDDILEALTRKGGGRYYFLNQPSGADEGFARQLAGAFRPAAENVKMQVRFNPARVGNYKLIGFEKHRLNREDFRNDKVTAAQLAAEEAAVALYQVQALPEGEGEIGEVFVRFRDPATGRMIEQSWTIPYDADAPVLDKAAPSMQLAATAALLAEKLRGGAGGGAIDLDALEPIMTRVRGVYAQQARVQDLAAMFEEARRMTVRR